MQLAPLQFSDKRGHNVETEADGYRYIHPHSLLLKRKLYLELPPFEKHGAPCLKNMIAAADAGYGLIEFPTNPVR